MKRWIIALGGIVVVLGPGALYSYSLFSQALMASFGWSAPTATWAFAIANFCLGLGAVAGGVWQDRQGPRTVAIVGSICWGVGNIAAGLGLPNAGVGALYVGYGVLGGFGCGMAYIAALSAVVKWFPERRGLGGGLLVMGFGLGAFVYNTTIKTLAHFGSIATSAADFVAARTHATAAHVPFDGARYALRPDAVATLLHMFVASGITFAVVGALASLALENPAAEAAVDRTPSATTRVMLATPQFYILWTMLFLNVTAGIIIISNAVPIMAELTGASALAVATLYSQLSLFNGFGRLLWGALSDRIGRKIALACIFGLQVLAFFALGSLSSLTFVAIAFAVVLLCYGGGFGTMPGYNADLFGTKHFGANYGLNLTAWGFAGLAGPWFVSTVKVLTGSYSGALEPVAIMLLIASLFPLVSDNPLGAAPSVRPNSPPRSA